MADFQNPQQDPGMERRLLLVFALTFLVMLAFQPLLKKYFPQAVPTPPKEKEAAQNAPAPPAPPVAVVAPAVQPVARNAANSGAIAKQAETESDTVIENDVYRITFTNRGARVKSWILKNYDDDYGHPLELVNRSAAEKYGYPLSLWSYDAGLRDKLNSVLYVRSPRNAGSGNQNSPTDLTFEYADEGIAVRKTFHFDKTYLLHVNTEVESNGSQVAALPTWPAGFGDQANVSSFHSSQIEYQNNSDTERLDIKKISSGNTLSGPFDWAGVSDQYFAAVFIPDNPRNAMMVTLRNPIDAPRDMRKPQETSREDVLGAAVGALGAGTNERIYVGPKSLHILESVSVPSVADAPQDLRSLVNFGYLGIIARPLFLWLRWTHQHMVPNWGWAIVLQTLIISLALLPLRISSMKSMLKMQRVQPQIKAIQEKYKKYSIKDPRKQEMNKEIWAIQKKEGVNPAGGCLPMLIPLILIWPYYRMLAVIIDLRHAHWLWITDLSARDPYFILPTLLVVSMIVTQRMTPQGGMDPAQQRMMNVMMPLMMGFIFYNLAAGLNVYYAETNLIQIAQQAIMNRTSFGREMREMALKRARKKSSS